MLKAHSWANLSVSDTPLYRHQDGPWPSGTTSRWKKNEGSSLSRMASSSTLADSQVVSSFPRHRKENSYRDKSSSSHASSSSHQGYLNNRNNSNDRFSSHYEINNNSTFLQDKVPNVGWAAGNHPQSRTDIPTLPIVSESDDEEGRLANDQMYSTPAKGSNSTMTTSERDQVYRAQSLGDLTTGLTLSVVGQRKTGSMLNLSVLPISEKHTQIRSPPVQNESRLRPYSENNGVIMEEPTEEKVTVCVNSNLSQENGSLDQGRLSTSSVQSQEKNLLKGKRSLPRVPVSEASERIKRFTELMKARMALHSSASQSTTSVGSVPVTPQQADRSTSGVQLTLSDTEPLSPSSQTQPRNYSQFNQRYDLNGIVDRDVSYNYVDDKELATGYQNDTRQNSQVKGGYSMHSTPQLPGDCSTDSVHTTMTSRSHSSTMDSGYTTNNDYEVSATMACHSYPSKRMTSNLNQLVNDGRHIVRSSGNDNHRTTGISHLQRSQLGSAKYPVRRLDPYSAPVVRGFCPVKEEYQGYCYNDPQPQYRSANQKCYDGQNRNYHYGSQSDVSITASNCHYGSQSDVGIIPDGKKWQARQSVRDHQQCETQRNKPVVLEQNAVATKSKSGPSERHMKSFYRIPDQNWNSDSVMDSGLPNSANQHSNSFKAISKTEQSEVLHQHSQPKDSKLYSPQYATLPGNWKFQFKDDTGYRKSLTKLPTLYQLSQCYTFHGAKVILPQTLPVEESIRLIDKTIELPSLRENSAQEPGTSWPPQGHYAKLGGPGSAFRPVRSGDVTAFTLIGIEGFQEDILSSTGTINKGDLLIEMNGRLILGADCKLVHKTLEIMQGEVILTVARIKTESRSASVKMDHMMTEIDFLRAQIAQRDSRIKELQTMLSWQPHVTPKADKVTSDGNIPNEEVEISDDEFIV